jgi:maleylpyruvate isomerase
MIEPDPRRRRSLELPVRALRAEHVAANRIDPAEHARAGMAAVRLATEHLHEVVATLDDTAAHAPSRLAGWSRGHVVSHLARNADGLVNLLTWGRTGVEHPMYASSTDRDADIEEGAHRLVQVQVEDLHAADARFDFAADQLTENDWQATVTNRQGEQLSVAVVPWMRLVEVLVHLSDLDLGVDLERAIGFAGDDVATMLDYVVWTYATRDDVPPLRLVVELPSGDEHTWEVGDGELQAVRGTAVSTLAWLIGRDGVPTPRTADDADQPTAGSMQDGALPKIPTWL